MEWNLISNENLTWLAATLILLAPPSLYIIIRNTIKIHRQGIVKDLSAVFSLPGKEDHHDRDLIPSFEFVKYKYFLGRRGEERKREQEDFAWWAWATGLLALAIVFTLIGFIFSRLGVASFQAVLCPEAKCTTPAMIFISSNDIQHSAICPHTCDNNFYIWVNGLLATIAGSYIFMMRNFFRAVNNFDFGPASYISAAKDFIISAVVTTILYLGLRYGFGLLVSEVDVQKISSPALIFLAFAFGMLPGSATQTLMERSKLANFKKQNPDIYKKTSVTPVDIVDGIDSEIRDRLADHHIHSTQNLATANPLMLFVETPYGVYQIMDWVAQAQLCCAVGPDKLVQFWQLGIRTLFDLERAALNRTYRSRELLLAVGSILFSDRDLIRSSRTISGDAMESLVISAIQVKLDDPHVHRLRQIYITVGERLGDANRRFCEVPRSDMNSAADGYFMWLKRWMR